MSRGVSTSISTGAASAVTLPLYLVKVFWDSGTKYYSSRETLNFQATGDATSLTYTAADILVNLNIDSGAGTLKIGNTDYASGADVLGDGVSGTRIVIMALYGSGSFSTGDEEFVFDGEGAGSSIDDRWTTIQLARVTTQSTWAPRQLINKANGFNHLPPDNLEISAGGEIYRFRSNG
jgi:hypothetical protein